MGIKKYEIVIGRVLNNGKPCKDPIVRYGGQMDLAIKCIDKKKGIYTVEIPDSQKELGELTFIISCGECHECPPIIKIVKLCNSNDDCDGCESCINKICVSKCASGETCCGDDKCCNCNENSDCPCNQTCKNNRCSCKTGSTLNPATGCCEVCKTDSDCEACEVCNNRGECIEKECSTGVCDPLDESCKECIQSSDCDGANQCCENKSCVCCPGFIKDNGNCIPKPQCQDDAACKLINPCYVCKNNNCTPRSCPSGQIATVIGNTCECRDACSCGNGSCDTNTQYCDDAGIAAGCSCKECEGTCATGCIYPCACNPQTNQCEYQECSNTTCTNGIDCGPNCGCKDNKCVPCFTLNCANEECATHLGCSCSNSNTCEGTPDNCATTSCSTGDECGEGCGCHQGVCRDCSNFACNGADCSKVPGCGCSGGVCGDDKSPCTDTLEIEKLDESCTIVGRLTKENCCQCPKITVATKGRIISSSGDSIMLGFMAELRKGEFDGISVNSVPRVDDFSNPNIAEDEPPTAGKITMSYSITSNIYELINGSRIFKGLSTSSPVINTASFGSSGESAEVSFSNVNLPKIGIETTSGNEITIVNSVQISFKLTNNLVFPNDCVYTNDDISEYEILTNEDYDKFISEYSYAMAGVVSSPNCRKPLFKWTKNKDGANGGIPFRKLYIDGNGTYEDVLDDYFKDKLESCYNYSLESDCTCDDPAQEFVVFCNPDELDYSLSSNICPKCLTINSFDPCKVNRESGVFWRVKAGTIDISFDADSVPLGQQLCSDTAIESIEYSIECDTQGVCTKTYEIEKKELEIEATTECDPQNQRFTVSFPNRDTQGLCLVDRIEVAGFTIPGGGTKILPTGTYTAKVYWQCGCDPVDITIGEDCCEFILSPITRDCSGNIQCKQDDGVSYSVNGVAIPNICSYVNSADPNLTINITANKGNCSSATITVPSISSNCCENFGLTIEEPNNNIAIASVHGGTGDVIVTATVDGTGETLNVVNNGNNSYTITGHNINDSVTVVANDSKCGRVSKEFIGGDCDLITSIEEYQVGSVCRLKSNITPKSCICKEGSYNINITSVVNLGTDLQVFYDNSFQGFDAEVVSATLMAGELNNLSQMPLHSGTGSFIVPIQTTKDSDCIFGSLTVSDENTFAKIILSGQIITATNVVTTKVFVTDSAGVRSEYTENSTNNFIGVIPSALNAPYTITINQELQDGSTRTAINTVTSFDNSTSYGVSSCKSSLLPSQSTPVKFELSGIELEDACKYFKVSQVFEVYANQTVLPTPPQNILLQPSNPNARKIKHTWFRDNVNVLEEWIGSENSYTSLLPENLTTLGRNYKSSVECQPCSDEDSKDLCCLPDVSAKVIGCNESVEITLTGNPGTYLMSYNGLSSTMIIGDAGISIMTFANPVDTVGSVSIVGSTTTCSEEFNINLILPCTPTLTPSCTGTFADPEYQQVITNCNIDTIEVLAGSGTVSGNSVVGISTSNSPTIQVTDTNGCVTVFEPSDTSASLICNDGAPGMCCKRDGTCEVLSQDDCNALNPQAWWKGRNCDQGISCSPKGTCCNGNTCLGTNYDSLDCLLEGGTFTEGTYSCTICTSSPTPEYGGCCSNAGECLGENILESTCFSFPNWGSFRANSSCASMNCGGGTTGGGEDTGACCYNNQCSDGVTESACQGNWVKNATCPLAGCAEVITGACCNPLFGCSQTTQDSCITNGYTFYANTTCCDTTCGIEDLSCQGRCCYNNNNNCLDSTEKICKDTWNGVWDATKSCSTHACNDEAYGSCCDSPGNCRDNVAQSDCVNTVNQVQTCAQRSDCDAVIVGACCLNGVCIGDVINSECSGVWKSDQRCNSGYTCPTINPIECTGCTGYDGTCCENISSETACNASSDCEWFIDDSTFPSSSYCVCSDEPTPIEDIPLCVRMSNEGGFTGSTGRWNIRTNYTKVWDIYKAETFNWLAGSTYGTFSLQIQKNGTTIVNTGCFSSNGMVPAVHCGVGVAATGDRTGSFAVVPGDQLLVSVYVSCSNYSGNTNATQCNSGAQMLNSGYVTYSCDNSTPQPPTVPPYPSGNCYKLAVFNHKDTDAYLETQNVCGQNSNSWIEYFVAAGDTTYICKSISGYTPGDIRVDKVLPDGTKVDVNSPGDQILVTQDGTC